MNGNFSWAKRIGNIADDQGTEIALDASESVYTTGFYNGTTDFDPGSGTASLLAGFNEIFISKLD